MRPEGLIEVEGNPDPRQVAVIAAVVSALLDAERREAVDRAPLAYRSRWRRAGIVEATSPFVSRRGA